MSTEMGRHEFVEGLHRMADFFQAHPDVPFPRSVELNVWIRENEREVLARVARALGTAEKTSLDRWFILKKNFSESVTVDFNAEREKICREDIQSYGEALCRECGLPIIPGELVAEVEDGWGMLFVHEACIGG